MDILGILFVLFFENIPVVVGLVIAALVIRKAIIWLSKNPDECKTTILD